MVVTDVGPGAGALVAGPFHSVVVVSGGGLRAWGWNAYGQLGDGTNVERLAPVPVARLTGVTTLAAGAGSTLAVGS